jgi:type IV secretory pathway VirB10-like protein
VKEARVNEIHSPSGLDLNPLPPGAVRLSKRAGVLALIIVAIVASLIGYGVVTRKQRAIQMVQTNDARNLTAATDAGKSVAAQVPARVLVRGSDTASDPSATAGREIEALQPSSSTNASPAPPPYNQPVPQHRELTPEEKRRALAFQQEMEALSAPTSTRIGSEFVSGRQTPSLPTRETDVAQIGAMLQALQGARTPSSAPGNQVIPGLSLNGSGNAQDYDSQNMQARKEAFVAKARSAVTEDYLKSTRVRPLGRYEIKTGWDIPAILEQALNSDLPGEIKALVRENVYDTASGKYLLIPQGSRLVGAYDSQIGYGQDGVIVVWNRIIFPDGSSVSIEGMAGQDAKGQSGLRDKVDKHYRRIIGFAVLTSMFNAAFQLSQSRRGGLLAYPSAAETAGSAVGRELSQFGAEVTRRNLNVQPTIKVPIGYRFNVRVNRDMLFEAPYRPFRT